MQPLAKIGLERDGEETTATFVFRVPSSLPLISRLAVIWLRDAAWLWPHLNHSRASKKNHWLEGCSDAESKVSVSQEI